MKSASSLILVLLTVSLILASCGKDEEQLETIRPVRYTQVFSTGGSRVRTFSGVARSGQESRLSFRVPGIVRRVAVALGDKVGRGDLIAQLDPSDYELRVEQTEARLTNAQAQARNAAASYERVRSLYENNSASRTDFDTARAANESATAGAQAAEKELELARLQLGYARLTAPTDGDIASVEVEVNENVQVGQTVVVLSAGSDIEVKVSMPEILISQVTEGEKVIVSFDAIPGRDFDGSITEVGIASTGMVTTFPVTVLLGESSPDTRAGMAAVVSFVFESADQRERYVIPSVAVGEDREGRFVYVVEPIAEEPGHGIIHRRPVTVGELTGDGLEIFEGLSDGDLVVTAGVSRITDGQKVQI
jgi:RND family efflux transporter MFP subunit